MNFNDLPIILLFLKYTYILKTTFETNEGPKSLFTRLIIRLFQLVFSAGITFFSHNKSVNSVFQPAYQPSRTGPKCLVVIVAGHV
jgi:hypothetical protein